VRLEIAGEGKYRQLAMPRTSTLDRTFRASADGDPSRDRLDDSAADFHVLTEEQLTESVREALVGAGAVREVKMFGGIGFILNGNLAVAASKRGLLARVGRERQDDALARAAARPMVTRGRPMAGYLYVDPPALTGRAVQAWVRLAREFVWTLPPKKPDAKRARAKGKRK
jgi:TfoX/Sxy family transcriptional regulator of competence genes